MAEYTPQELARLNLGYLIREHDAESQRSSGENPAMRDQRQKIRRGQQAERADMLRDLGIQ